MSYPLTAGVGAWRNPACAVINSQQQFGDYRMNSKILAIMVAVMAMVAIPTGLAISDEADADTGVTGTYSVYAYDGNNWYSEAVSAYDAAQAVKATTMWDNDDSMVEKYTPGTWVTYNYTTYGNIDTFMGLSNEVGVWNIFIIDVNGDIVEATDCLGSYKCYSDYDEDHRTANIILIYDADVITADEADSLYDMYEGDVEESDITIVTNNSAYKVTFKLSISYDGVDASFDGNVYDSNGVLVTDCALKNSVVEIVGYGSDCYLALKNAVGSNNFTGTDAVPGAGYNAYGWMDTLFGLGTVQTAGLDTPSDWTDDSYAYWCIYDASSHLADFVLGAYSPVDIDPTFAISTIILTYEEVNM